MISILLLALVVGGVIGGAIVMGLREDREKEGRAQNKEKKISRMGLIIF